MSAPRDRDVRGRPRNARPRDELGRPLPRGVPGVEPLPEDLSLSADETLLRAQELLDAGRPFQAHEVLEAAWKSGPASERDLWQGLAQLAVGMTHAARGNSAGAGTLVERGCDRIRGYAEQPPHRVDVAGLLAWGDDALGVLRADPTGPLPVPDLIA